MKLVSAADKDIRYTAVIHATIYIPKWQNLTSFQNHLDKEGWYQNQDYYHKS